MRTDLPLSDVSAEERGSHEIPSFRRRRISFGAVILIVLFSLAGAVGITFFRSGGSFTTVPASVAPTPTRTVDPGGILMVHLHGAVPHSGLYELAVGSRVVDAVMAAGGFADNADQAGVNLARTVMDGEQLWIPAIGEQAPPQGIDGSLPESSGSRRMNLNTASEVELDVLPRIGPSLASRIVAWREENGRFGSVDDLLNIDGFGEKTVAGLRDLVTV